MKPRVVGLLQREPVRFAAVGLVNTGLDLGAYVLLHLAGVPLLLANLISTSTGLTFSFTANRAFTFSARPARGVKNQLLLFIACTGIGLWVVQPLVILGIEESLRGSVVAGDLQIFVSKAAAIVVGVAWNWVLYNRVVFRAGRGEAPAGDFVAPGASPS